MAASTAADEISSAALANGPHHDPFLLSTSPAAPTHHRFSNFDSKLFALGPSASPTQAKRALEAHLAETDRRMEEAGKLGTALVQQRKELTERLKDVEKVQTEGELSPGLREKLVEIEKDYNEVAKESARAFLPKQRIPSNESAVPGSPFVPEGKGGRRSVSPSKFEAQATGSPTKLGVPNRKVRNQPANRVHDIEFAAEISTSLIAQVRNLQGLLSEKEDELREVKVERSKLEYEAEGFQQRVKALDESEHRYKDENWNLETQIHDLMAKEREAADREKKLNQTLNILQAEKNAAQRELDEVKLSHSKLTEEHTAAVKHHDIELGTAKRNMVMGESERAAMQRKIEDLAGQNQELAKAVSVSYRGRALERDTILGMSDEDFQTAHDNSTPEHSPPPSPVKGTPRHAMLESETLKSSLGHAQRTIQGLRNNVHREKTEKMETRRLLQEARDELERLRNDPLPTSKRARKAESKEFKKPPRLLGGLRSARSEIFAAEDPEWEDQGEGHFQSQSSPVSRESTKLAPTAELSDHFDTGNETSDAAFETANERGTETDDFHTGAEEFSSDDVETETESPSKRHTLKGRPPSLPTGLTRSTSMDSSASTEDESYPFEGASGTPTSLPPLQHKFPLRVSRGAFRRSRHASEEPTLQSSPASFANSSTMGTPQPSQSLAAELGDFDGSDNDSNLSATPSRRSIRGRTTTPPPAMPPLPKVKMVDSGMMTEPLPELSPASPTSVIGPDRHLSMDNAASRFSMASEYSDFSTQDMGERLDKFPSPPTSAPKRDFALPPELAMSTMHAHHFEPVPQPDTHAAELASLRADHAEQLKQVSAENTAAQTAALEALRAQHADQLAQFEAEAKLAHAQELEALRSSQADAARKVATDAQAAYALELQTLKASHAEQTSQAVAEAQAIHAREIESLKASHAELGSKAGAEAQSVHARELDNLRAVHAEESNKATAEAKAAHARELDDLRVAHARESTQATAEAQALHTREMDVLRTGHAEQLMQKESESKALYAADLEALKASHAEHLAQQEAESNATYAADLETLKSKHTDEMSKSKSDSGAAHAAEIAALIAAHASHVDSAKQELADTHAKELDNLKASHAEQIHQVKQDSDASHAEVLDALKTSHQQQIDDVKNSLNAAHLRELASLQAAHANELEELQKNSDLAHAAEIAALVTSHSKQLDSHEADSDATLSRELTALKGAHAQEIDSLNSHHAAARAQELEGFKAALAKQVESSKVEGDASHNEQIEALNSAHAGIIEAHKRDSEKSQAEAVESLKFAHERQIDFLKSEHAAARSQELEDLATSHLKDLDVLKAENESSRIKLLEDLANAHSEELEALRQENELANKRNLAALSAQHATDLEAHKNEHGETLKQKLQELADVHSRELENLRQDGESAKARELAALGASHAAALESSKGEHKAAHAQELQELADAHSRELTRLRQDSEAAKSRELAALAASHGIVLENIKNEHDSARLRELEELNSAHVAALASLRAEHQVSLDRALSNLKTEHASTLDALKQDRELSHSEALEALGESHSKQLDQLKRDGDAALAQELDAARAEHANILAAHQQQSSAEKDRLLASHASELEALRKTLTIVRPSLGLSSVSSIQTEPIEIPTPRSPRREAFIVLREDREPHTPFGRKSKGSAAPIIAEDDTRQSPSNVVGSDTPESQRPFKEMSTNTDARPRKQPIDTSHQSSQTILTADALDRLMKNQRRMSQDSVRITTGRGEVVITPYEDAPSPSASTVRVRRSSQDSVGSVARARHRMGDSGPVSAPEPVPSRRPGSSASARAPMLNIPPLPPNHREVIEAARTNSSSGGKGSMGPPFLPASAYCPTSSRPQTPSGKAPLSPASATPRAGRTPGYADIHSPTKMPARSRQSSMSSFASEIDTRFNARPEMSIDAAGFGPGTDPRMIQAITQTMIGEYLWKYTRKAGRGEMSENRHRRYFWVHPYTRTLYWSDRDPSTAGRAELKAKSVPIEAVRVVTDDNPMPPGLHRKSLIIISPGRTIKFTCTTGQRHETWFNALSYLLLRTGEEHQTDAEEMAGHITQEDVDEFNPAINRRPANGNRARPPPSLSSYNSRTTRNESPNVDMSMSIPTLTPTHEREGTRGGTLGRLSGYWKSRSTLGGTFSSMRSRSHTPHEGAIYEASEVHDSAEDLRQMIEQQDRESDRLENVRACCDGKHDVGTLSHASKRGRLSNMHSHSHTHTHPGQSSTATTPMSTLRSRA
ncbi:Uu.00g109050.m01.CDS01 [Anthostomella pinea]|uniref:Uu.00g109050.m01.CDS01 n=1 Tax=Anthostomella pinea TaxID=933095 RepID=A0AAI8VEM9_9PEZI|nr:Uu.00g109050.m01.CDS01 [Anthostomella pinea]